MVEVLVKRNPEAGQTTGDWSIKKGRGRGGSWLKDGSGDVRHFQRKSKAVSRARQWARGIAQRRDVGVTLFVQNKSGTPKKESEYNGGDERHQGNLLFTGGLIG